MAIDNIFPKIGEIVESADKIQVTDEQDERFVQEIESLCMKCEEQVRVPSVFSTFLNF
jgi:hypothetical protein